MVSESPRSAPHLPGHAFAVLAGQQTLMLGRAERAFQPTRAMAFAWSGRRASLSPTLPRDSLSNAL